MAQHDRRAVQRYVVGDLFVDIDGTLHETVDVSDCAVAVVRRSEQSYDGKVNLFRFVSSKCRELNQNTRGARLIALRGHLAVFMYDPVKAGWESILAEHDVRSQHASLEDVFG